MKEIACFVRISTYDVTESTGKGREMKIRYLALSVAAVMAGFLLYDLPAANAYNSFSCPTSGIDWVRWSGNTADYDYTGNPAPSGGSSISDSWWQNEIIYAAAIWNHPNVGADFTFYGDTNSSYPFYKKTNYATDRIAETIFSAPLSTCALDEMETYFNTRYSWAICSNCNSGTYDVRTVALHEFGHWLVLDEIPSWKFWDNDCAMYADWHGTDHTLCGHDEAGIQEIYGTD